MRAIASTLGAAIALLYAAPLLAQPAVGGVALNQLEPAPAGDDLFAVSGASVDGHLEPRAFVMFDHAQDPLVVANGGGTVVSSQDFLRIDASLALWDRLLFSLELPLALAQSGDGPVVQGATLRSPSSSELGDLRLGVRGGLLGDARSAFALGLGAQLYLPTGASDSYAGEGAVRVRPELSVGGHLGDAIGFVWGASAGAMIRGSDNPSSITFGAGGAVVLADDMLQIGPEIYGAAALGGSSPLSTATVTVDAGSSLNLELLFGAKLRVLRGLVIGAGAGPGLSNAIGTPSFRALGSIGWAPRGDEKSDRDSDGDGFLDSVDGCPTDKGVASTDPAKNGCPIGDGDRDGVPDSIDACPEVVGVKSDDPKKNGCTPDADSDGVVDAIDACPDEKGVFSDDPTKNGCPNAPPAADRDLDGVPDSMDACADEKGVKTADPKTNGCPADRDLDGIPDASDACPNEKGASDPDPKQNGCPREVRVTDQEIVILRQVQFVLGGSGITQTIDPVSDDLLTEVRDVIHQHPEITKIEVQGHTDPLGGNEANMALSQARADSIRKWLVQRGIPAAKLVAKGYGATMPVGDNATPEGRQKNRRVQFVILKKEDKPR